MKTADLAYVSPTGQETALTDEQLVAVAAEHTAPGPSGRHRPSASRRQQEGTEAANTSAGPVCRRRARCCR